MPITASAQGPLPILWRGCAIILVLALVSGCETTTTQTTSIVTVATDEGNEEEQAEEELTEEQIQDQIEIAVDAMATSHARIDAICEKLITHYGEKAIPELAANIENTIMNVRLNCIYCLGMIYERTRASAILELHPRLVDRYLNDPETRVRLQAAATLFSLNDYRGVPLILKALRAEESYVRLMAVRHLRHIAGQNYGYDHLAPRSIREQQAQVWDQWWQANGARYLAAELGGDRP